MSWAIRRRGFVYPELAPREIDDVEHREPGWRCRCGARVHPKRACLRCEPYRAPAVQVNDVAVGRGTATLTANLAEALVVLSEEPMKCASIAKATARSHDATKNRLRRLIAMGYVRLPGGTLHYNITVAGVEALNAYLRRRPKKGRAG